MSHLIIDIGNSFTKVARFVDGKIDSLERLESNEVEAIQRKAQADDVEGVGIASVGIDEHALSTKLDIQVPIRLITNRGKLPIESDYLSKDTLGIDRLANATAAHVQASGKPALAIDTGTCLTYDLVNADGVHLGGAISPGLRLRGTAMHEHSARLPLVVPYEAPIVLGRDTTSSLASGIYHGIIHEIEGFIAHYRNDHPELYVVICGGDALSFQRVIKSAIFADPLLTLKGLYAIYKHQ